MFSLFPNLLDLYPYAALILRVTAGCVFVLYGWRAYHATRTEAVSDLGTILHKARATVAMGVGVLFVLGLWVQGAALAGILLTFLELEASISKESSHAYREMLILLWAISFSLLFLGAGPFAIDLPL